MATTPLDSLYTLCESDVAIALQDLGRIATALERIAEAVKAQAAAASFLDDALQPAGDESELTPETIDFYRTTDGAFRVRTPQGDREPTPAEAAVLRSTVQPRQKRGR